MSRLGLRPQPPGRSVRTRPAARGNPQRKLDPRALDPEAIYPANRQETLPIALMALTATFLALAVSARQNYMLLYGDAVAHLGIARRIVDTNQPGLAQLGSPWLPLPHLLMLPFIGNMEWWRNGMAGAWPSMICYVLAVVGLYRLARRIMPTEWAFVAAAFFGLNANLLYLSTTAMNEPLFLALLLWITLVTCELLESMRLQDAKRAAPHLVLLGLLLLAAVMTRYDGWIVEAVVWCVVAIALAPNTAMRRRMWPAFSLFTLLVIAGPTAWFTYNHVYGHDWLDFMRGPYSAKEIDRRTSPPGSHHYFGWHDPAWSLMLYARTAQVDAFAWETGWLAAATALWASYKVWASKLERTTLLLWIPLPFYVYSISYGSVPIFIPQLYPHSFYNSRYGLELLPALTLFFASALSLAFRALRSTQPLVARLMQPVILLLAVLNLIFMLHSIPLVLKEAMVNSRGRLAIEVPLAQQLAMVPRGATILMDNSEYVGALQTAGIPLKQTIGPADYYGWKAGLAHPAETAALLIATEGDQLQKSIAADPQGLTETSILCTTGHPCLHFYRSSLYRQSH